MGCLPVIVLLLLATAPAALADSQSSQAGQGTQKAQDAQIFGLPPLPVALVGLGTLLSKVHSPININTRVVTDKPAEQQVAADTDSTAAAADTVYSSQTVAGGDTQQLQASSSQPVSGGNSKVPPGVTSWIQNPDGTITPLKWETPDNQATAGADDSQATQTAGDQDTTSMPQQQGQVISGTIITGSTIPINSMPAQQGGSFNYTGSMSQQNVTYSTPSDTQDSMQGSVDATVVTQTPMVVAMPVAQPQPQQQQVWMPVAQGTQMMQGYYIPGQSKGAQVVQGYYAPAKGAQMVQGYYVNPGQVGVAVGTRGPKGGWGVRKVQGSGWVSGGMRPAGMTVPAGQPYGMPYGQMQGPMWGNQGQPGMMGGGQPRGPMGPAPGMGGPAQGFQGGSSADDSSSNTMDDGAAQQQQQWAQGPAGGFGSNPGRQGRAAVMEPTVLNPDNTNPNSSGGPAQPTRGTAVPPQGSQPGPIGPGGPGMGPRQAAAGRPMGPGGMGRRPPAMIPVNGPPQGADGVMAGPGGSTGGMDGDDNMNN